MFRNKTGFFVTAAILSVTVMFVLKIDAEEKKNMGGWELNSSYNKLYNPYELESFKGTVVDILEIVPIEGMSPAVALIVKESEDEKVMVHLCPRWFADPNDIGIKKGDRVKVKGAWCELDGEDIFMASKVKKGDYFEFKVRLTKNGKPFWTMSPEELAMERSSK
jgi:hypothetical protein